MAGAWCAQCATTPLASTGRDGVESDMDQIFRGTPPVVAKLSGGVSGDYDDPAMCGVFVYQLSHPHSFRRRGAPTPVWRPARETGGEPATSTAHRRGGYDYAAGTRGGKAASGQQWKCRWSLGAKRAQALAWTGPRRAKRPRAEPPRAAQQGPRDHGSDWRRARTMPERTMWRHATACRPNAWPGPEGPLDTG